MIAGMRKIKLEKWVSSKDGRGDFKEYVTETVNTWAEVSRSSGDRSSINGQTGLTNFFVFKVRFGRVDPTGNWRITYDRRLFTVHSIEKEGQGNFWWIIKAEAKGAR